MSTLLTPSDFIGDFSIPQNSYSAAQVQAYLDQHERDYIYKLFGVTLAETFLAAVAAPPPGAPFLVIYNAFTKQGTSSAGIFYIRGVLEHPSYKRATPVIQRSYGILDMLKAFMYYHIMRDKVLMTTGFGLKKPESEASSPAEYQGAAKLDDVWNRGVQSYLAIQWYMRDFAPSDYSTYAGDESVKARYLGGAL